MKAFYLCVLISCVVVTAYAGAVCRLCSNEILVKCASACQSEATCDNRKPTPKPGPCTLECVQRCECRKGFIRREKNGKCIRIKDCPLSCQKNEVINECASACKGEATCDNRNPTPRPDTACTQQCIRRCECAKGYVRNADNKCIKIEDCPLNCQKNEVINECASACKGEATCDNRNPTPRPNTACTLQCIRRCECAKGYVRNADNKCVKIEDCPARCSKLEVWKECASLCLPEATCDDQKPTRRPGACSALCLQRCECINGYVRNTQTGQCVKAQDCPRKCSANEILGCKPCCEPASCQNPKPGPCESPCTKICISTCLCKDGYVRNKDGKCVLKSSCPKKD